MQYKDNLCLQVTAAISERWRLISYHDDESDKSMKSYTFKLLNHSTMMGDVYIIKQNSFMANNTCV